MSNVEEISTNRVLIALETQGSAQAEIAKNIAGRPLSTDALVAMHLRAARKFKLLHAAVQNGLLEKLEAEHGTG